MYDTDTYSLYNNVLPIYGRTSGIKLNIGDHYDKEQRKNIENKLHSLPPEYDPVKTLKTIKNG